jgi:replicative DNA helicase
VFRLKLASGREITATANHPFLTYDGWKPLGDLAVGTRLAVARHVPPPLNITSRNPDEVVLLAHMIGDGSFVRRQPIRYASIDEENLEAVSGAALRRFGITGVRDDYAAARVTTLRLPAPYRLTHGRRNPIASWLDEMGLFGLRSHEKFVPSWVYSLPKEQVALFLRHLWATDGCVHWYDKLGWARIYYASTSRRLVDDVARLLLRFNIVARVKATKKHGYRDCYQLLITGSEQQKRFIGDIGVHGARGLTAIEVAQRLESVVPKPNVDTIPGDVWTQVRRVMSDKGVSPVELAASLGARVQQRSGHSMSRSRLAQMATVLGSAELEIIATNDVMWDRVTSIESLGMQSVYDATVMGTHNFLAEGIALHNSIEQDADMVVLLHREELYERESPRAGEADFIVAKHRNGPTATITVAFQGHYSRFVDMAQS